MTGYVSMMVEKEQTFPQFAMSCARNFGALIMMRDDPMDAEIPQAFEPSSYHAKAIREAENALLRLKSMNVAEQQMFGRRRKAERMKSLAEGFQRESRELALMKQMQVEVGAWQPPPDHANLKRFMLEQLQSSMGGSDYYQRAIASLEATAPEAIFAEELARCHREIAYHAKEDADERRRTDERNRWVSQLRKSLEEHATSNAAR